MQTSFEQNQTLAEWQQNLRGTVSSVPDSFIQSPRANLRVGNNTRGGVAETNDLTTRGKLDISVKSPLLKLPSGTLPTQRVTVLQQWEGVVTEVCTDTFFAELDDLTDTCRPVDIVELSLNEIAMEDRELVREGACFYWSIGYETSPGGTIRRISEIRMKRVPKWSRRSLEKLEREAESLFDPFSH
jgi:hypothetical protein